ncbi:MAG: iron-sulfur cluster assembly scaffold protein [Actinomycetota bacterium]|nr:iron-sulfur cluster assembly scaffold protein [Actinomycetota bacterium]MDD5667262.1 iron-sulfur cluster assembly scaffold protein [Actinomycetota bacterium]
MDDELDSLQQMIEEDMRSIYSKTVIDHAMNPRNMGRLKDADGWARYTGPCGDTMEIWIKLSGDKIEQAGFFTDGCGTSIASGSMVTELATDKELDKALEISQNDVLAALDGLPEESEHCALLAATTLKLAISDYLSRLKEPWRKHYDRR